MKTFSRLLNKFFSGAVAPYRGILFLKQHKTLWKYLTAPILISFVLFAGSAYIVILYVPAWMRSLLHVSSDENIWLQMLRILVSISLFFALLFLGRILTRFLSVPFLALLAERSLFLNSDGHRTRLTLKQWISRSFALFGISLVKTVFFLLIAAVLFLLSFVPGLQPATSVALLVLSAIDCFDYVFEADGLSLSKRIRFVSSHLFECSGLGLALGVAALIPGLYVFLFPAAVVGASLLYSEKVKSYKK